MICRPTRQFGWRSLPQGEPTVQGGVAGAQPNPVLAARAGTCPAAVLGHTAEPSAGRAVQEEKAPTHRPLPTLHQRRPWELQHHGGNAELYSKAVQLGQPR